MPTNRLVVDEFTVNTVRVVLRASVGSEADVHQEQISIAETVYSDAGK
jgi:hypothetical protein